MPERARTIQIPRWIQLVGLPLVLTGFCGHSDAEDDFTALPGRPGPS